jgi:hypothetical protein
VRTRTPIGKALVALATLVVAGVAWAVGGVRAEPATAAASCVAVVVDFHLLGGPVQTGCAQGDPTSGLQALTKAGFSYAPRPRDGLICQIDAKPACTDTTTTKYWSYWYRAAGSAKWVYGTEGAATHNPKPGSTEGWVWQNGGKTPPPGIRADVICPQLAGSPTPKPSKTPKPTSNPTIKPSSKPTTRPPSTPTSAATGSTTGKATPAAPTSPHTSSTATASATGPPAPSPSAPGSATPLFAAGGSSGGSAVGPADHGGGGGSLGGRAGAALGGAVVVGIGAAAALRARRGRPQ